MSQNEKESHYHTYAKTISQEGEEYNDDNEN